MMTVAANAPRRFDAAAAARGESLARHAEAERDNASPAFPNPSAASHPAAVRAPLDGGSVFVASLLPVVLLPIVILVVLLIPVGGGAPF